MRKDKEIRSDDPDRNPDPITKAPGAHPIGTGLGAAAGGAAGIGGAIAAGAAMGTAAGPIGTATGAAIGAVVGGLVGKGMAEGINPTEEHAYWRSTYRSRPYVQADAPYDEFAPAYQYGWESQQRYAGQRWEDVEDELSRGWERARGKSRLSWGQAKSAARDAWARVGPKPEQVQQGASTQASRGANGP
jgi:hypothetical protein